MSKELPEWEKAPEEFVVQWGSLGTQWGIPRTMAQIHALLMTAPEPMCLSLIHISADNPLAPKKSQYAPKPKRAI